MSMIDEAKEVFDIEIAELAKVRDRIDESIKKAEEVYEKNKDMDTLINFWENLWQSGGLKFEGVYWHFRLIDLYIKVKRRL